MQMISFITNTPVIKKNLSSVGPRVSAGLAERVTSHKIRREGIAHRKDVCRRVNRPGENIFSSTMAAAGQQVCGDGSQAC
jgi:hypothetical protein